MGLFLYEAQYIEVFDGAVREEAVYRILFIVEKLEHGGELGEHQESMLRRFRFSNFNFRPCLRKVVKQTTSAPKPVLSM